MAKTRRQSRLEKLNKIESLHINLLHQILSFLPTLQVVQSSVLSKIWKNIWRSVPCLYFHEKLSQHHSKFGKIVDTVLAQREESNLEKLHLNFYHYNDTHRINAWLEYAARNNNQSLYFEPKGRMLEDWTCHICSFQSLVHLKLRRCYIRLQTPTSLPNLRTMELEGVFFTQEQDEQTRIPLVSLCPSLERVVMHGVEFSSLVKENKICAPKLKKLDVDCDFPSLVEISAPNLVSLKLVNSEYFDKAVAIRFNNGGGISMVEDAHIRLKLGDSKSMIQLFRVLENVRSLALYCNVLQSLAMEMQKDLSVQECIQTPLSKLKQLELQTSLIDCDIFVINTLLKHSSAVETLVLKNEGYYNYMSGEYSKANVWFKYEMFHLKQVVIHRFKGLEEGMRFVKFLLGNAPTLKKLIITFIFPARKQKPLTNHEKTVMFNKKKRQLYSYMRTSSSVKILFTRER